MATMTSGRALLAVALLASAPAAPAQLLPDAAAGASPAQVTDAVRLGQRGGDEGLHNNLMHSVQRESGGKSQAQAAREARERYGGKVLSVSREGEGNNAYYRVKLIDNGNVRVVRISAN